MIGVAIQGVGKRDSRRSKLTQAAHQRRAQISPVVAEVEILGLPVWGRVGARGRGSLRVGVLPMRPQERFEAAIRESEEVLGANRITAKRV